MKTAILAIFVVLPLLVGTQIQSQMVVANPAASSTSLTLLIATEQEVRQFFDKYVERYTKMDIEEFLLLFSLKAKQNQKDGLPEIRMIYANFFNRSKSLQFSIEDMKIEIFQNAVEVKAHYTVNQVLKEGGEKRDWKGDIHWILAKEEEKLEIISIDYRYSMPPTLVVEGEPKPKEEPAGKAVVKPGIPPKVEEEAPELPPPLVKKEEVKQFFSSYIDRYHSKDIDGFLSFFSSKAVQNQKDGLEEIRKIYTKFFDQSRAVRYQIEGMEIEIYQNRVDVKARFRVDQILKKPREEKVWSGNIRWVLGKEEGVLKILSLDYQNEKSP